MTSVITVRNVSEAGNHFAAQNLILVTQVVAQESKKNRLAALFKSAKSRILTPTHNTKFDLFRFKSEFGKMRPQLKLILKQTFHVF